MSFEIHIELYIHNHNQVIECQNEIFVSNVLGEMMS
jgi:hypothetical protein